MHWRDVGNWRLDHPHPGMALAGHIEVNSNKQHSSSHLYLSFHINVHCIFGRYV